MDSKQLEERCSEACTRAGLAALLLSLVVIPVIGGLSTISAIADFSKYIVLRENLSDALDDIKADNCWAELVARQEIEDQADIVIEDLRKFTCFHGANGITIYNGDSSPREKTPILVPRQRNNDAPNLLSIYSNLSIEDASSLTDLNSLSTSHSAVKTEEASSPPDAPVLVSIGGGISGLDDLVDILVALDDTKMLNAARSVDYQFDRSIYRWQRIRDRIYSEARYDKKIEYDPITRSFDKRASAEVLTLSDVADLAKSQYPDVHEAIALIKNASYMNVPNITNKVRLGYAASILIFTIGVCVAYFWVFLKEATTSKTFPAAGTLFGAFRRNLLTKFFYCVLALFPVVAVSVVTYVSFNSDRIWGITINAMGFLVVVFFTVMILKDSAVVEWSALARRIGILRARLILSSKNLEM